MGKPKGAFRDEIVIKAVTSTSDGQGGTTKTGTTDITIFAQVKPVSAKRMMEFDREFSSKGYEVTIHRDDFDFTNIGDHTILWESQTLKPHSIQNSEFGVEFTTIMATL